jgi:hypothetical protein
VVKVGILCEGESETILLNSDHFKNWLKEHNLDLVEPRVVGSKNQYWKERLESHIAILKDLGVDRILILVDLDDDKCITSTKQMILNPTNCDVIVCVKEFENWYLADTSALTRLLKKEILSIEEPVDKIIELNNGKGFGGSKPRLAMKMRNNEFSFENAANHPNCPSAAYFLNKLNQIAINS